MTVAFLVIYMLTGKPLFSIFSKRLGCTDQQHELFCLNASIALRLLLSLTVLHALILVFVAFRNTVSRVANEELFIVKFGLLVGGTIGLLYVPNDRLTIVVSLARYPGLLYLLYQNICLMDFGFFISEMLWIRTQRRRSSFFAVLMCFAFSFCLLLLLFSALINWSNFWRETCDFDIPALVGSWVVSALLVLAGFLKIDDKSHFLTGSFVGLLFSLNVGSALGSYWTVGCNPFDGGQDSNRFFLSGIFRLSVNLLFAFVAAVYSAFASETSIALDEAHLVYFRTNEHSLLDVSRSIDDTLDENAIRFVVKSEFQDSGDKYKSTYFARFHLSVLLFLFYLVCLFFEFGTIDVDEKNRWKGVVVGNQLSFYGKTFATGVMLALYFWVVLARKMKRRDK